jgi:hypothetical protein
VARDQHDVEHFARFLNSAGDLEAIEVRQLDIYERQVGSGLRGGEDAGAAIRGLSDHVVAAGLEHAPRGGPEALVVIDDENCASHA